MLLAGGVFALCGFAGAVAFIWEVTRDMAVTIYLSVVAGFVFWMLEHFLILWGRRVDIYGRQHLSQIIETPQQLQPESFVLYLRSFEDDPARQSVEWRGPGDEFSRVQNILLSGLTQEEQLVAALKPVGPVVALGRPGEALPVVGALRIYLNDDSWRDSVLELMKKARLVVIALGSGSGLMWELLQAVQVLSPDRLILIALMRREAYTQFQKNFAKEFSAAGLGSRMKGKYPPTLLPRYPSTEYHLRYSMGWIIRFERGWKARTVVLNLPWVPVLQYRRQFQKSITRALGSVLRDPVKTDSA